MTTWKSINQDMETLWWQTFALHPQEAWLKTTYCPVCSHSGTLVHYYMVEAQLPAPHTALIGDTTIRYDRRGSGWQWCGHCMTYEHFRGYVPTGWSWPDELALPENINRLTAEPTVLHEHLLKCDKVSYCK